LIDIQLAQATDAAAWDAFVQSHAAAQLAHQVVWRDFIPQTFNLQAIYWIARDGDQVVGLAPFFLRNHLGLGRRLTSIPYINTGGLLTASDAVRDAMWDAILKWASAQKIDSIELRNRESYLPAYEIRSGRSVSVIPLPSSEDEAWSSMKSVARNRIRKAQQAELTVQHGFDFVDGFYAAYVENMRVLGAPPLAKKWFANLMDFPALKPHLITLAKNGETVAGMVLLIFKDGTENNWTGSTLAARSLYCNDLLYWEAMRWAIGKNLGWLDLGRSEAGGTHEKFKEKFGAVSTLLSYQEIHREGDTWTGITSEPEGLYHAFTSVWKRLPMPIHRAFGPYFSRQIY
jgi:FemAB-related protein (PEP-CTERM system-associated)